MNALFLFLSFVCAIVFTSCAHYSVRQPTLRVATWNVENLFDFVDDPKHDGDDEFNPSGWRRWSPERYQLKSLHLAEAIAEFRPDLIFLQEIENRDVLTNLTHILSTLPTPHPMPYIAHEESPSTRGIDVAILSRYPLHDVVLHMPIKGMRGILEAHTEIHGIPITLFACHWKSWVGNPATNVMIRKAEASFVRQLAENALLDNPESVFYIAGDFNDDCDGESLMDGLGSVLERPALQPGVPSPLYHLVGEIPPEKRGSFYYARRKVWNTFDGIVIPAHMLYPDRHSSPSWCLSPAPNPVQVHHPIKGIDVDGRPRPFRRVRKKDGSDSYVEGCSDHFPVWADFVVANP